MAQELELKYGCNPNQKPARIYMTEGELPVSVLNGRPGYINFLDALNGWQLVKEMKAIGIADAAVDGNGYVMGTIPSNIDRKVPVLGFIPKSAGELSPLANAYARARGADRMSSFGDWISLSDPCDVSTAKLIKPEMSDGIIAPDYEPEALEILKAKHGGAYNIVKIDPAYVPAPVETKQVFGVTFEQGHNFSRIDESLLNNIVTENKDLPENAKRDLIISLITLKYTQSNSVCYVKDGQAIGIGAGQQSRIHCTRLAGSKADNWLLRQHPQVMGLPFVKGIGRPDRDNTIDIYISDDSDEVLADGKWQQFFTEKPAEFTKQQKREWLSQQGGVSLGSDAFFPFGDNIERAFRSGVKYVAQPGGSLRDDNVIEACNNHGMVMCFTGLRLFHH